VLVGGALGGPVRRELGDAAWSGDVRALADTLNALARERDHLRDHMAQEVARVGRGIEQERNRLAALMSELSQAVVVCNLDGRILLYNNRARLQFRALGAAPLPLGGADMIGLGRSIYTLLDRERLQHGISQLSARLRRGAEHPTVELVSAAPGGHRMRVLMAPVRAADDVAAGEADAGPDLNLAATGLVDEPMNGFVLVLERLAPAVTPPPEAGVLHPASLEPARGVAPGVAMSSGSRPVFYDFDLFVRRETGQALVDRRLAELSFTVFDTETTGLDPSGGDRIIQIGAVRLVNGRLLRGERFEQLVDPQRPIPPATIPIHGITPDMVAGQPPIEQVLPAFHRYASDTVLVAHNAAFDLRFLQLQEQATGVRFEQPVLDTLLLSAVVHPQQASHQLEAIAERFGVAVRGRHTALGDAIVTAEVFLRLLPLLADRGIHTLGQAREAAQKTWYARLNY
jgi:DNA polymerase III epsilon subunit